MDLDVGKKALAKSNESTMKAPPSTTPSKADSFFQCYYYYHQQQQPAERGRALNCMFRSAPAVSVGSAPNLSVSRLRSQTFHDYQFRGDRRITELSGVFRPIRNFPYQDFFSCIYFTIRGCFTPIFHQWPVYYCLVNTLQRYISKNSSTNVQHKFR